MKKIQNLTADAKEVAQVAEKYVKELAYAYAEEFVNAYDDPKQAEEAAEYLDYGECYHWSLDNMGGRYVKLDGKEAMYYVSREMMPDELVEKLESVFEMAAQSRIYEELYEWRSDLAYEVVDEYDCELARTAECAEETLRYYGVTDFYELKEMENSIRRLNALNDLREWVVISRNEVDEAYDKIGEVVDASVGPDDGFYLYLPIMKLFGREDGFNETIEDPYGELDSVLSDIDEAIYQAEYEVEVNR